MYLLKSKSVAIFAFCFLGLFVVTSARLSDEIDYSPIPTFNDYDSVIESADESLEPIYEFSKDFIDASVPVNFNIGLWDDEWNWDTFAENYVGLVSYVIVTLVIGLLIPIIGIIFCISRCCCNCCGARAAEKHPKQGKASIIIAGAFTIVFSAFLFFAIVVGMRSNVVIEQGAENVFNKMIVTMRDINKYTDNTYKQMDHLMTKNYEDFSVGLSKELKAIGNEIDDSIDKTDITEIKIGLTKLEDSITDLETTEAATKLIQSGKTGMDEMRINTLNLAEACILSPNSLIKQKCNEIKDAINVWIIPPFNDFPDLSITISELKKLNLDARQLYLDGLIAFGKNLGVALEVVSIVAADNTAAAGIQIKEHLMETKDRTDSVKQWITKRISDIKDAQGYYNDYGKLRYGLTFLLPLLLICVVIFVNLGFLIGMCCRTVYYKEKGCGNASAASDFFMINTSIIFIFTIVFAVAICGYYAFGVLGQRFICNTFDTMDNVKGLKYLDDNLNIAQYFGDGVTFEHLLNTCYANKSIYEVLMLKNEFDLDDIVNYINTFGIEEALNDLKLEITNKIELFENNINDPLTDLKMIDLDRIVVLLHEDQTEKMDDLIGLLTELLNLDPEISGLPEVVNDYLKYKKYFVDLQTSFDNFKTNIKMGGTKPMQTYAERLEEFDKYLNTYYKSITNGNIVTMGDTLTDASIYTVKTYLNRIKEKMTDTIGLCQPASVAVKATLNEVCGNVFNPINAFWVANFFALVAFIPLLIIFIYLVSYFRRYIMSDEDRYQQVNYYLYNPPGTRGSAIEAYDVRDHHQPDTATNQQQQQPAYMSDVNVPSFTQSTPLPPIPPNQYYNPNSGTIAPTPRGPLYPALARSESEQGNNMLTSAAELAGAGIYTKKDKAAFGVQGRNLRRQQEYPYAMKGTSIASDVSVNGRDEYTRF